MTFGAVLLDFILPAVDDCLASDWVHDVGIIRATQAEGARAILTTLAGAAPGVAGVAFSVTIVADSFANSNYGPRLIGNFMGDRTKQIVLGIFVATFVYCITVLSTVHARLDSPIPRARRSSHEEAPTALPLPAVPDHARLATEKVTDRERKVPDAQANPLGGRNGVE